MEQKYLVIISDLDNNIVAFFRHSEKQLSTVVKQEQKFWSDTTNLRHWRISDDYTITIHKTNFTRTDENIVYHKTIRELLEAIL